MKAFVTGTNGFTGSHLVRLLLNRGYTVTGLVRKSSDLSRLKDFPEVQLVYGDLTDQEALKTGMAGADYVFHTAAYVELGLVDAAKMQRVNVEGTCAVLEVAKTAGIQKMVYCSTVGIYGNTNGKQVNETYQREQVGFSSAYDSTKYEAQQLVDAAARDGLPVVSVMPSGIMGPDDPHFGPVIEQFLKKRLKLWAGGERITGIVHVDDLVEGMLLAAEKAPPGEHYILSAGDLSTREMFALMSQSTGIPVPVEAPKPLVRLVGNLLDPIGRLLSWQPPLSRERVHYVYDRCVRVDATKARQQLGWQPRSVEVVLQELVNA
jgi:dihydroflavonol-4-reductase